MPVKAAVAVALFALLAGGCRKKPPKSQFEGNGFGNTSGMPTGAGGGNDSLQRSAIPPGISWMCFRDLAVAHFSYCARSLESCDEKRSALIAQEQQAGRVSNVTNCGSQTTAQCHTYKRYADGVYGFYCTMEAKDCEDSRQYYKKRTDFGEVSVCASVTE